MCTRSAVVMKYSGGAASFKMTAVLSSLNVIFSDRMQLCIIKALLCFCMKKITFSSLSADTVQMWQ